MRGRFTTSFAIFLVDEVPPAPGLQHGRACDAGAVEYVAAGGYCRGGRKGVGEARWGNH